MRSPPASLDPMIPPWPLFRRPRALWASHTGAYLPRGTLSSSFFNALLLLFLLLLDGVRGDTSPPEGDPHCISKQAMDVEETIKRHVIDIKHQQTMALTIADTDRVSHRLTNAIFKKFLQGVVGYQEVELDYFEDNMSPLHDPFYLGFHKEQKPSFMVNLEVWFKPGYSDHGNSMIKDRGSQGTGGRYGWFVYNSKGFDSPLIFDHWRSYQSENVTDHFALTTEQQLEVERVFTRDQDGNTYCPDSKCPNGIFVPEICSNRRCATLFAGAYSEF